MATGNRGYDRIVANKYEYNEADLLGRGSFGEVYEGQSKLDQKKVAIKLIKFNSDEWYDVQQELKLMKIRKHPNVMGYMEDICVGRCLYIVMKKCDGNLYQLMQKLGGRFKNSSNVHGMVSQISAGYEALYHAKILHRDIKPQNILYCCKNSNYVTLKLCDLGSGKIMATLGTNTAAGTIAYMAPEIIEPLLEGKHVAHYDARADLWSLALVFCQAASGLLPTMKFPVQLPTGLPVELRKLCSHLLAPQEQRMQPEEFFSHIYVRSGSGIPVELNLESKLLENANIDSGLSSVSSSDESFTSEAHIGLVKALKKKGAIRSEQVERAMLSVDRKNFVRKNPYEDQPQSLGYNISIAAPHMHADALELLKDHLLPGNRALDVHSGSGYLTACMAIMVGPTGKAVGIEHVEEMAVQSIENFEIGNANLLDGKRLIIFVGDGSNGYSNEKPYDAIYVGAVHRTVPEALTEQLAPGGRLILPVGNKGETKKLCQIDKLANGQLQRKYLFKIDSGTLRIKKKKLKIEPFSMHL